ncbi:uncharacterized protein DUF5058 [Cytobacillus horneckiae]|uniref:DUF5058 domain-containing protein n=1 Tax=Cytobacillus horneckiae TaxID=549687 RepID=A0A2N0ZGH8_9BACI|nr:DUF5058 family protein [Cytobacillus horneckiae]NRG45051.1 DUF5058 family protein [Bacillus sp. CRN 9]MBN6888263.1 DUF5058 family protein [Cytobacillus horneckiae]MCM3177119.1 DUF5058 family protein [Cytobacillus horneckiae]MEC1154818.1 DUF5058 family protein [Cytobacillus horneckiae]MED2940312.1 DUF5058 family protein [Cytobacillus horneckiae]
MEESLKVANSPVVWIIALTVIGIVIFQGIIFIRMAAKTSQSVGLSKQDVHRALKIGAINAIGPSLGIMVVAVSLITLLGDPLTLMRIGIIGSAATESMGASLAATAYGTELGSSSFNAEAMTTVVWVLCIGGTGWLLFVALFTKSLGKIEAKVSNSEKKNGGVPIMIIVSSAAMLAVFGNLLAGEMFKGYETAIVTVSAAASMGIVSLIANKKPRLKWLHEWSLGLSIIAGLTVSYFTF